MHLVTVATHSERYFPVLQESCRRYGANLVILGANMKYTGHFMKDELVYEYITKHCDSNDIVCFVDGFDSVLLCDLYNLEKKFKAMRVPLVVSTDNIQWWKNPFMWYLYMRVFGNRRINTGMYIGYAYALEAMLNMCLLYEAKTTDHSSNQKIWNNVDQVVPNFVTYDNSTLFLNYWTFFGACMPRTLPCVLSSPANGNMNILLRRLGYTENLPKRTYTFATASKLKYYVQLFIPELCIILYLLTKCFTYLSTAAVPNASSALS